jgi:drug/metabolite transporter (DMT)-like permease
MSGELIALLTTCCWSLGIFPFTEASLRIGAAPVNHYRLLLAWLILSVILIFYYGMSPSCLFGYVKFHQFLFLGLSGIIGFTIGDYCSFKSFTLLGPKLGSLYTTVAPGAALITGYFVLHESINTIGILGILITLGGVIGLTLSKQDHEAAKQVGFNRTRAGILYGITGALCQGVGLVVSKLGLDCSPGSLTTMHAVWIRLLFAFTAAFTGSFLIRTFVQNSKPIFRNQKNGLPFLILGTLFGPVAGVTLSLYAIQKIEVAVAQTIFALLPIFVLPINLFVYKEKITRAAVFSCVFAVGGVFLLIWRNKF